MKKWKKFLIVFLALGLGSVVTLSWYASRYSMEPIAGFEVNSDTLKVRILIATQGSEFKNAVVNKVIDSLKREPVYLKVIDVSLLGPIIEGDWNAIVILRTWEYSRPPKSVQDFVSRPGAREKSMVITTSGSGSKMKDIDAITSASKFSEQEEISRAIISWIRDKQK